MEGSMVGTSLRVVVPGFPESAVMSVDERLKIYVTWGTSAEAPHPFPIRDSSVFHLRQKRFVAPPRFALAACRAWREGV